MLVPRLPRRSWEYNLRKLKINRGTSVNIGTYSTTPRIVHHPSAGKFPTQVSIFNSAYTTMLQRFLGGSVWWTEAKRDVNARNIVSNALPREVFHVIAQLESFCRLVHPECLLDQSKDEEQAYQCPKSELASIHNHGKDETIKYRHAERPIKYLVGSICKLGKIAHVLLYEHDKGHTCGWLNMTLDQNTTDESERNLHDIKREKGKMDESRPIVQCPQTKDHHHCVLKSYYWSL